MATLISYASGNLTGATTFRTTDTASGATNLIRNNNTTIAAAATLTSVAFTVTNGAVIDGVMLYLRAGGGSPTGTVKVALHKSAVEQASVTVNKTDLPDSTTANWGPSLFKFTSTATGDGAATWTLVITTTGTVTTSYQYTGVGATTSPSRALRTTTAATPAAADNLYILGELTGAATHNSFTVTMDSTAATVYGDGTVQSATVAGGAVSISCYGTLTYGTMGSTVVPTTWDAATATNVTLSGGNLVATSTATSNGDQGVRSSLGKSTGKFYFETTFTTVTGTNIGCGICLSTVEYLWWNNAGRAGVVCFPNGGAIMVNESYGGVSLGGSATSGTLFCVAVDFDNLKIWFRRGASGNWNANASYDPATNTGGVAFASGTYFPISGFGSSPSGAVTTTNFGASAFSGVVPSGFTAGWSTSVATPVAPTPGTNYILRVAGDVIVYQYGTLNMGSSAAVSGTGPQATAFLARTTGLDTTHTNAYGALIDGLVTDGLWTKFDMLHVYATQDSTTALLNLVSTSYNGTANGSPTFTADRGFTGSSGSSTVYIDTGFASNLAVSAKHVQNSAHISAWSVTNLGAISKAIMGIDYTNSETNIFPNLGGSAYFRANSTGIAGAAISTSNGHYIANRSTSASVEGYVNGAAFFSNGAAGSTGLLNDNMIVLGIMHAATATKDGGPFQVAMSSIGSSLTLVEATAFYNRLRTYMTAVGVP